MLIFKNMEPGNFCVEVCNSAENQQNDHEIVAWIIVSITTKILLLQC
jgi:hypothetical protein